MNCDTAVDANNSTSPLRSSSNDIGIDGNGSYASTENATSNGSLNRESTMPNINGIGSYMPAVKAASNDTSVVETTTIPNKYCNSSMVRSRLLKDAFINRYREITGIVGHDIIMIEYEIHDGSVDAAIEAYLERTGETRQDIDASFSTASEKIITSTENDEEGLWTSPLDCIPDLEQTIDSLKETPNYIPVDHKPQIFGKEKDKSTPGTKTGERLRQYFLPIFESEKDCHRALMLWFEVGDVIPVDSAISRALRDNHWYKSDILYDLYGIEGEISPCYFDTRAEIPKPGLSPKLQVDKLLLCISRYAKAMGLHNGKHVTVERSRLTVTFGSLFAWINSCNPESFRSDLDALDEWDRNQRTVARHTCFNGITRPVNRGLPCTCTDHFKLGPQVDSMCDIAAERMIIRSIKDERPIALQCTIDMATRETDTDFLGVLPVKKKKYTFSDDELRLMRQINEEIYNLPGLKAFFDKYTETYRPCLALHPVYGRWTVVADIRFIRLAAAYSQIKGLLVHIKWPLIHQFAKMFPSFLPELETAAFAARLNVMRKKYTGLDSKLSIMPMMDFLENVRSVDFPADPAFDLAVQRFEKETGVPEKDRWFTV